MEKGIWQEIEELYMEFQQLGISQSVDYEKYYLYSLITHSTAIEGSTLTEMDAQLLFDEGVTAKGKPLVYHLMNEDLKKAYELAKKEAQRNTVITPAFLKSCHPPCCNISNYKNKHKYHKNGYKLHKAFQRRSH